MPVLKFRNYLAASRKHNCIAFGMYQSGATADLDVIEDTAIVSMTVTGTQDGSNTAFIVPGPLGALYVNGLRQAPNIDYTVTTGGFTLNVPPNVNDTILAFSS